MATKNRTVWTFVVTSAALFMAALDNLVVTTALPSIRDHLHAGLEGLEWTVNAYTLTFAVLLLAGAALGDRFGRRRVFLAGLTLFTLGIGRRRALADIEMLIVARALQGVGGGGDHAAVAHAAFGLGSTAPPRCCARRLGRASAASPSRSARWSAARWCRARPGSSSSG